MMKETLEQKIADAQQNLQGWQQRLHEAQEQCIRWDEKLNTFNQLLAEIAAEPVTEKELAMAETPLNGKKK